MENIAQQIGDDISMRYQNAQGDVTYPPLPPEYLYLDKQAFQAALKHYALLTFSNENNHQYAISDVAVNRQKNDPLQALKDFQAAFNGRLLLCSPTLGRQETVAAFLARQGIKAKMVSSYQAFMDSDVPFACTVGDVAQGFMLPENTLPLSAKWICILRIFAGKLAVKNRLQAVLIWLWRIWLKLKSAILWCMNRTA